MQHTYRRRTYARQKKDNQTFIYSCRRSIIKQSAVSLLIFAVLLMIKMSAKTLSDEAINTISYTVDANTDWKGIITETRNLVKEAVGLNKGLNGREVLTKMQMPTEKGEVTSEFGIRADNKSGTDEFHYGVDFSGDVGDKILCVSEGTVSETGYSDNYGNYILIKHDDKISSFYAHCEKVLPAMGDKIKSGQVIATLGNSGNITEPCLHFEIREADVSLDPMVFLKDK